MCSNWRVGQNTHRHVTAAIAVFVGQTMHLQERHTTGSVSGWLGALGRQASVNEIICAVIANGHFKCHTSLQLTFVEISENGVAPPAARFANLSQWHTCQLHVLEPRAALKGMAQKQTHVVTCLGVSPPEIMSAVQFRVHNSEHCQCATQLRCDAFS